MITQGGGGLRYVRSSARRLRLQIHTTSVDSTVWALWAATPTLFRHSEKERYNGQDEFAFDVVDPATIKADLLPLTTAQATPTKH